MYVTRMTIPVSFQMDSLNCQSLLDDINENYDEPDRQSLVGSSYIVEWDAEDRGDAIDMKESVEDSLRSDGIKLDTEDSDYSGIRIDIFASDGTLVDAGSETFDDEDDEDNEDEEEEEE